jgi:hypothetical protein
MQCDETSDVGGVSDKEISPLQVMTGSMNTVYARSGNHCDRKPAGGPKRGSRAAVGGKAVATEAPPSADACPIESPHNVPAR